MILAHCVRCELGEKACFLPVTGSQCGSEETAKQLAIGSSMFGLARPSLRISGAGVSGALTDGTLMDMHCIYMH